MSMHALGALSAAAVLSGAYAGVTTVEIMIAAGQEVTGEPGVTVGTINPPFTSSDNKLGLNAGISTNEQIIFYDGAVIFRSSEAEETLSGGESNTGVGPDGRFIYSPSADGNDAAYTDAGLIGYDGQEAPGFPGQYMSFCSRPQMFGSTAYFIAGLSDTPGGSSIGRTLYREGPETLEPVVSSGDVFGEFTVDLGSGVDFDYSLSDDNQHHVHVLGMAEPPSGSDTFVMVDGELVLREGDPTGDGDNWASFDIPSINVHGDWMITGDTDTDASVDEFIAINGVIVVREGDTLDGFELTGPASLRAASLNDLGQVAHVWTIGGGTEAAFIGHICDLGSSSRLLLATGDMLDTDGDGTADAEVLDINSSPIAGPAVDLGEDGNLYIEVELSDVGGGVAGDAIIRLSIGGGPDINGDGLVGVEDLLAVLGAWGPCGCPCPEDVDGDGTVAVGDLLAVLSAWDV